MLGDCSFVRNLFALVLTGSICFAAAFDLPSRANECPRAKAIADASVSGEELHSQTVLPKSSSKELPFAAVNDLFREYYANARNEILESFGPIIIADGSVLTLVRGKERKSENFIPDKYTGLKEVSHVNLGTYMLLLNHCDQEIDQASLERLRKFKAAVEKAAQDLDSELADKSVKARQLEIISESLKLLNSALLTKHVSKKDLQAFARSMAADDLQNAYEAASAQLRRVDEIVAGWKSSMPAEDWGRLYVVVTCSHMAKSQFSVYQYFARLLKQDRECDRVILTEPAADIEQSINTLMTHRLDRHIGEDYFQDPWRMHRDLLSDAAAKYLKAQKKLLAE
ncbi:MAG: hypothetical protein K2X27_05130 [Candidatus Obscuribacterales bacterium]|nr:hypothetical protein [Candidatus Obscuribacterales bacterium]